MPHTTNRCPTCKAVLEKKFGPLKYRCASRPDNNYPGTLLATRYFWCKNCSTGYVSPTECGTDLKQERALQGADIYALLQPDKTHRPVQVVEWLK